MEPIETYRAESGLCEFTLPQNSVLVWRDSTRPEAVLINDSGQIPKLWSLDIRSPLKIIGEFSLVRKLFPKFQIPPGSKVLGVGPGAVIRLDLSEKLLQFSGKRKKRVVIVDDSGTMRKLLSKLISQFRDWEVVGESPDAEGIGALLDEFHPDLVTLDLNLGEVNGATAMKMYLAPRKIPTLLITSQAIKDGSLVMEALSAGALDYLQKPESGKWNLLQEEMLFKMETALKSKWQNRSAQGNERTLVSSESIKLDQYLVAIGSSTGGTQALEEIFTRLPSEIPPIIVTQHIPAGFSRALAERLNKLCPFEVKEAEDGDEVRPGRILIAPGDHHMRLRKGGRYVEVIGSEPVNRFRPSVEVMFGSVAQNAKVKVVAVMLTGMGKDGAEAMLELKNKGAQTIAQDEETSVVFGMPKEAIRIGAAKYVKPLTEIPSCIYACMAREKSQAS